MKKFFVLFIFIIVLIFLTQGCATNQGSRNAYHAGATAAGLVIGQLIGGDTAGTLIGGGIGYVVGGLTKDLVFPDHNQAAIAAAQSGETVQYRVSDSYQAPVYTAQPIRQDGNCTWVLEKEWDGNRVIKERTRQVCKGSTPWNPGAPG